MRLQPFPARRAVLLIIAVLSLLASGGLGNVGGLGGLALAPPAAAAATRTAAAAGNGAPLVLIDGSLARIAGGPGASRLAAVVPAGGGLGGSLLTLQLGGRAYAIPSAALPYLGRGLAPSLFDLGLLQSAESGGRLPVQISYTGPAPALPGITITQAGPGSAQGYLTATSARAFGSALVRQFITDHARGDYGSAGLFAGGVSIGLPGTAPPAQAPGLVMHTLTVKGKDIHRKPDTGDIAMVFNVDNPVLFDDPIASSNFFFDGTAKFSVPAFSQDWGGWVNVEGTSAAAPLVAGVYALAGNAATAGPGYPYRHAGSLFDVTSGNNDWFHGTGGASCGYDYLCVAKPGYDAPTGLGTPDGTGAF